MMQIGIALPGQATYNEVSQFARLSYKARLHVRIRADPDVFAYACEHGHVCGCFGLYRATDAHRLLLETYVPDAFEQISGTAVPDRRKCAELGTRAVEQGLGPRSSDISLALSATLIIYAREHGVTFMAFTANRTVSPIARALGVELIVLGSPDTRSLPEEFLGTWSRYFRVQQLCFGFRANSLEGCRSALKMLESRNFSPGAACS